MTNLVLDGKVHDLGGGMTVRRLLPQVQKRMVGPFTFFDHMGPLEAQSGSEYRCSPASPYRFIHADAYLFEGRIVHRDSLWLSRRDCSGRSELDDGWSRNFAFGAFT